MNSKKNNIKNNNFLLTQLLTKKQNFNFFFSSTGEVRMHPAQVRMHPAHHY